MPAPARRDIEFTQGDSYIHTVTFLEDGDPLALSGATVRAQIRSYPVPAELLATFTVSTASNVATLELAGTATAQIPTGNHRWDLEIEDGGLVATFLSGDCTVLGQVTVP